MQEYLENKGMMPEQIEPDNTQLSKSQLCDDSVKRDLDLCRLF